jgi:hypothetical protein
MPSEANNERQRDMVLRAAYVAGYRDAAYMRGRDPQYTTSNDQELKEQYVKGYAALIAWRKGFHDEIKAS